MNQENLPNSKNVVISERNAIVTISKKMANKKKNNVPITYERTNAPKQKTKMGQHKEWVD